MQKAKHLLFLMFLLIKVNPLAAQTAPSLPVSLQDLFDLANQNNRSLKILDYNEKIAEEAINNEKKKKLPTVDATVTASYNGDGWISDRDFSNGMSVPIPDFGNNFALEATQVIYAGGALNTSIKSAKLNHLISQLDKEENKQDIRFAIAGHYLELKKLNNQEEILRKNIQLTKKLLAEIETRHKQGVTLRNNITRYELQLQSLELALLKLENTITIINNELVKTLQLPRGTKLTLKDDLEFASLAAKDKNMWQELAKQNAAPLQKFEPQLQQAKNQEALVKSEQLPQVFAYAGNYLNGPIMIEVPVIDKNFNYWSAGVGIKYNIASLYKNSSKKNQARLATQKTLENNEMVTEQLVNDIDAAHVRYNETFKVYETQLKGVSLATENYNVIRNRYLNDLVLITEMLDAENAKVDAELKAANAQINILFHYYQLKKLTGTL